MASLANIEAAIPALAGTNYSEESQATEDYNCIAYAFGDTKNPWWPKPKGYGYYWPPGFDLSDAVDTLKSIFRVHGYIDCDSKEHEVGYEKVAIYSRHGKFLHAARQLQSGRWASKLGDEQDIEHEQAKHVTGDAYGEDIHIMRKRRKDWA